MDQAGIRALEELELDHPGLASGSRVGVIGGGPAGSFFSYFLLDLCDKLGVETQLEIFEPRDFDLPAPHGCNMCGGIISESLVQLLAAEGIDIPDSVVQRGIDSYVLHTDEDAVRIETPLQERRIGAVYRGGGPHDIQEIKWHSFDGHLLDNARRVGAEVIRDRVECVEPAGRGWNVTDKSGVTRSYDLLAVATGVNSGLLKQFQELPIRYQPPKITKTFIREYFLGEEGVDKCVGTSMHVFLLDLPGLEFAALIPKGDYITVCLLGARLDNEVLESFLAHPAVRSCFPPDWDPGARSCQCAPKLSVRGAVQPFADGLVFIGDTGATRLYKDGIGAAYRTAKAAAKCVAFEGIRSSDFRNYYLPVCRAIEADNRLGKCAFWFAGRIQRLRFAQDVIVRMTRREQRNNLQPRMSRVLWDLFTGSAPYRDILRVSMHPAFIGGIVRSLFGATFGAKQQQSTT